MNIKDPIKFYVTNMSHLAISRRLKDYDGKKDEMVCGKIMLSRKNMVFEGSSQEMWHFDESASKLGVSE